ncbi:MAG: hypothetical protein QM485_06315, partial [Flavobacteriaceae bacterium]
MNKKILIFLLTATFAYSQTTVTLEDQCNCQVLSGTAVNTPGLTSPAGVDTGDIYVNTNTGTIYFWDGNTWELTSSDNQQLQNFNFNPVTNILSLDIENGNSVTVSLSSLVGTDNQTASEVTYDNTASGLSALNVQDAIDEINTGSTDNQNLTGASLSGVSVLQIDIEDGISTTVDLSALDNSGTDNQNIESLAVDVGTNVLTVGIEDGTSQTVDLSHLDDAGTDDQNISGSGLLGTDLTIGI